MRCSLYDVRWKHPRLAENPRSSRH
ncbi:MAG: hypothetical protein RR974_12480 [Citrobacter sp.]|nr:MULTISPECIES: hypothetical protein [Citrobacter]MCK6803215.1 hypothetical protein [Enterobacter cloacae]MDM2758941.1 hypothetical protein [Citrobacter sp. Cpo148]MDT9377449.1 hypothetical protein [Citrobacter freundii]